MVQNIRLILRDTPGRPLTFVATIEDFGKDAGRRMARQFPAKGRDAVASLWESQRDPGDLVFAHGRYWLELRARLDGGPVWRCLCVFALCVTEKDLVTINERLVAHDNDLD